MRAGIGAATLALLLLASCSAGESPVAESLSADDSTRESEALESAISLVEAGELSRGIQALEGLCDSAVEEVRVEALRWLGHGHTRNMDPEAALIVYREALQLAPLDPWLHYAAGTALFTIGDLDAAVGSYSEAIALDERHLKSLQWRGHTQSLLEHHADAAQDFERALELLNAATPEEIADWDGDRKQMIEWTNSELARSNEFLESQ